MGGDAATTTRLRPSAFARQFRHTEARGDGILQRFHDLPGKQASELPGFRCRPGKVRVRHQHDEFLSAVARHDIRQPELRLEKRKWSWTQITRNAREGRRKTGSIREST